MPNTQSRLGSRRRDRQRSLGHMCPQCRKPWALSAVWEQSGFVVLCRRCSYTRPVLVDRSTR